MKLFIISFGGSLINPGQINIPLLKQFKSLVTAESKKGNRFIIVIGGGKPARDYQAALRALIKPSVNELDWMGIHAARFNAHLVRLTFQTEAYPEVVTDPTKKINFKQPVLIASGWKPGWSTDFVATVLAKTYGANTVINLSNIDHAYTKDPRAHADAQKMEVTDWKSFRKIVGNTWNPGANAPFDPVASKLAEKENMTVIIANGKNLSNLKNILAGKRFTGTTIK